MSETIVNMNFMLSLDGQQISCRSISGMQTEQEPEYIQEGGLNGYVHIRPKPDSKAPSIRIERYVTDDFQDVLPIGGMLKQDLILEVGKGSERRAGPSIRFTFKGCMVTKKDYSDLNAEKGGILVETTTISYQEMKAGGQ